VIIDAEQPEAPEALASDRAAAIDAMAEVERAIERLAALAATAICASASTPASAVEADAGWSRVSLALSAIAFLAAAMTVLGVLRRKYVRFKREDESAEQRRERIKMMRACGEYDEFGEYEVRSRKLQRIVGVIAAALGVLPIVLFLALDNLSSKTGWWNRWTPFVIAAFLAAAAAVSAYLLSGLRLRREQEREEIAGSVRL
jgi:hypothetical protein